MRALLIVLAIAVATPAAAQHLQSQRLGGTTYHTGRTADGASITGTSRQLGNSTLSEFRSGGRQTHCTTRQLGSRTLTECH